MSNNLPPRDGILFVISAPSGAGKTTLCKEIIDFFPSLRHSVSYTTRPRRAGETEGVDYHFVSRTVFDAMIEQGSFAEWAEVHGNRYGTAVATLERYRSEGHDVLLDIDCQGARQLKTTFGQGVFIFILPPSLDELQRRLTGRNTDAPDVIARRFANARDEIREALWYDYLVVNDDLPQALTELKAIVIAEGCRTAPRQNIIVRILESA
jgi:guanylate kinase